MMGSFVTPRRTGAINREFFCSDYLIRYRVLLLKQLRMLTQNSSHYKPVSTLQNALACEFYMLVIYKTNSCRESKRCRGSLLIDTPSAAVRIQLTSGNISTILRLSTLAPRYIKHTLAPIRGSIRRGLGSR